MESILTYILMKVSDVLTQKIALRVSDVLTHPGQRCPDICHLRIMGKWATDIISKRRSQQRTT